MTTQASPFSRILDDLPRRRTLAIPPPTPNPEAAVAKAVKRLAKKHDRKLRKAENTIEKFGLTIEATRLRDRLARAATTDVQRLVLSTAGVPEALFLKAIKRELKEEESNVYDTGSRERLFKTLEALETLEELEDASASGSGGSAGAAASAPPETPASRRSPSASRRVTGTTTAAKRPVGTRSSSASAAPRRDGETS